MIICGLKRADGDFEVQVLLSETPEVPGRQERTGVGNIDANNVEGIISHMKRYGACQGDTVRL